MLDAPGGAVDVDRVGLLRVVDALEDADDGLLRSAGRLDSSDVLRRSASGQDVTDL